MVPPGWTNTTGLVEFETVARDKVKGKTWDYDQVFEVGTTKEWQIKGLLYSGVGLPHERDYSRPILSQDMEELGTYTITDVELALGTDIDIRLLEDNRHIKGFLNKIGSAHGEAFMQAKCLYAAKIFNLGTDSTNQPTWESTATSWFSNTHTLKNGDTVDNLLAAMTVGHDSIWDMIDWLRLNQYSQKGLRKGTGGNFTFVHYPSHTRLVSKVLESSGEADTLYTNNKNTLKKWKIKPVECIELSDTNSFFMLGGRAKKDLVFRVRKGLTTEWDDNKRNRTRSALCHMRLLVGLRDWDDSVASYSS